MNTCSVKVGNTAEEERKRSWRIPTGSSSPWKVNRRHSDAVGSRQQSGIQPGRPSLYEVVSWQAERFFVGFTLETTERWDLKKGAGEVSSLVKQPEV